MNITVTVGFNAETMSLLNKFVGFVPATLESPKANGAAKTKTEKAPPPVTTSTVTISIETLRKLAVEKGAINNEGVKKALKDVGAKSVSNVPEEKYLEFHTALTNLS